MDHNIPLVVLVFIYGMVAGWLVFTSRRPVITCLTITVLGALSAWIALLPPN